MNLHPKVAAGSGGGTFGGALALLIVWVANRYYNAGIDAETATALGIVLTGGLGFIAAYLKKDTAQGG